MVDPLSTIVLHCALSLTVEAVVAHLGAKVAKKVSPRLLKRSLDSRFHTQPLSPKNWGNVTRIIREELDREGMSPEDVEDIITRMHSEARDTQRRAGRDSNSVLRFIDQQSTKLFSYLDKRSRDRGEMVKRKLVAKLSVMTDQQLATMLSSVNRRLDGLAEDHREMKDDHQDIKAELRTIKDMLKEGHSDPRKVDVLVQRVETIGKVDDPMLYFNLAEGYERQNDMGKAAHYYERAVMADKSFHRAWAKLGLIQGKLGRWDKAAPAWENAATTKKTSADYFACTGNAYRQLGDIPTAIKLFERAVKLDPHCSPAWTDLGELWLEGPGDGNRALSCFKNAVASDKRNHHAWGRLGYVHYLRHEYSLGVGAYSEAIKINDRVRKYWFNLALCHGHNQDNERAILAARHLLERWAHDREAWEFLGDLYEKQYEHGRAEECYRRARGL